MSRRGLLGMLVLGALAWIGSELLQEHMARYLINQVVESQRQAIQLTLE